MSAKKILGILFLLGGMGLFGTSVYIKGRVEEGKQQVSQAEAQVDQGLGGPAPLRPFARRVEKEFTGAAQSRIASAKGDIAHYEQMAKYFQFGGIGLFVIGAGMLIFGRKK